MSINKAKHGQNGFTLVELAIVLVIISVLLGSFIGTLVSRIETTRYENTTNELEEIKQALIGYAFTNGYLPCPDCIAAGCPSGVNVARDGVSDEVGVGADCDVANATGNVPWVTLGMGRGDAWNTRYRYWVDPNYTNDADGITLIPVTAGVGIIEEPNLAADPTGLVTQNLANNVVAVIFSQGINRLGGLSTENVLLDAVPLLINIHENENTNDDLIFHSRPPTPEDAATAGGPFDDIVIWISEYELKAKMVEAGALPP